MVHAARLAIASAKKATWNLELLSQPSEIAALTYRARAVLSGVPATAGPRFFLASVTRSTWIPRVVVVKRGSEIQGILYAKERKVAGLPTGLIFGHSTLGNLVVAAPGLKEVVLERALHYLLAEKRIRGIRILAPPVGLEMTVMERIAARGRAEFSYREDSHHQIIPLPCDYEAFLQSLSVKARRNMRYYRRRYEAAGHRYVERMDLAEFRRVALRLLDKSVVGGNREGVTRAINMFAEADNPLLTGLRRSDGEWVAILGGWIDNGRPIVLFQMNNDREYRADSLSAVLRAFFIETLIAQGYRQAFFWAGVDGPVARAAISYPSLTAYLDAGTFWWRTMRSFCKKLAPYLPQTARTAIDWVAPPSMGLLAQIQTPSNVAESA